MTKHIYFTNKQTFRFMKKVYAEPTLVIEEVVVESGIAASPSLMEQNGIENASYYDYGEF